MQNMKKLTGFLLTILVIAVVSLSFTSCGDPEEPDVPDTPVYTGAGVYNPGKKVSNIYMQMDEGAEYLSEEWIWNGNKVASISYFDEDGFVVREDFIYESNRINQIKNSNGYRSEYFYTDKKYEKVICYDSTDVLSMEILFQYDGDKIASLTIYNYGPAKNVKNVIERGFLGKLLPKGSREIVAKKLINQPEDPSIVTYTYDGENLSSLTTDNVVLIYSDYDTHSNYQFNFYPISAGGTSINSQALSKNNPGLMEFQIGTLNFLATLTYTYVGDFPTTIRTDISIMGETMVALERIEYK